MIQQVVAFYSSCLAFSLLFGLVVGCLAGFFAMLLEMSMAIHTLHAAALVASVDAALGVAGAVLDAAMVGRTRLLHMLVCRRGPRTSR